MIYHIFTILPSFVILFWLIVFLVDGKTYDLHKRFLIAFLGVAFVNYVIHWFYFNHYYEVYRTLEFVWVFTSLSVFPLYYYYIRLLTVDKSINFKWIWILLPAILLSVFTFTLYRLMNPDEVEAFIHEILYRNKISVGENTHLINLQILRINLFKIIFGIQVFLTLFFGLRLINSFNKRVYAFYSNVENRELNKIKTILIFFVLASIISSISNLLGKDYFTDHPYLLYFISLAHSIVLFGISYVGYKQRFSIRELIKEPSIVELEESTDETVRDNMVGPEYDRLFLRIKDLFDTTKIYKDPELKMIDVALRLGTNRTYISRLIHNRTSLNFSDFVNEYRVKNAEELLSSTKEPFLSLEEIAFESGFTGSSSFYRAFKKKNGIPPGRYRKIRITHINSDDE